MVSEQWSTWRVHNRQKEQLQLKIQNALTTILRVKMYIRVYIYISQAVATVRMLNEVQLAICKGLRL